VGREGIWGGWASSLPRLVLRVGKAPGALPGPFLKGPGDRLPGPRPDCIAQRLRLPLPCCCSCRCDALAPLAAPAICQQRVIASFRPSPVLIRARISPPKTPISKASRDATDKQGGVPRPSPVHPHRRRPARPQSQSQSQRRRPCCCARTSRVKSTWPGVSMMLMRWPFHRHVVAAAVMVMPRSCSWTIQSMVAVPSCTSPAAAQCPPLSTPAPARQSLWQARPPLASGAAPRVWRAGALIPQMPAPACAALLASWQAAERSRNSTGPGTRLGWTADSASEGASAAPHRSCRTCRCSTGCAPWWWSAGGWGQEAERGVRVHAGTRPSCGG
jgi:hypothetical protein